MTVSHCEGALRPAQHTPVLPGDLDIYRSANELIKQYGDAADIEAAMRADERLAAGDVEGEAVWLRIVKAIAELLSEERPDDAEVH